MEKLGSDWVYIAVGIAILAGVSAVYKPVNQIATGIGNLSTGNFTATGEPKKFSLLNYVLTPMFSWSWWK